MITLYRLINTFIRNSQTPLLATTTCKYYPSCSQYAELAIKERGIFVGSLKSIWRIIRCNPWSRGGIDFPSPQ
ncbi:MAG TPA: membrane protein insertion efficiency factor YidD [Candidatus Paceibacterota bacterium]|nr:membrane protein insertion efficiency factor YidD [Candidatus Paceibacterota bacterium]